MPLTGERLKELLTQMDQNYQNDINGVRSTMNVEFPPEAMRALVHQSGMQGCFVADTTHDDTELHNIVSRITHPEFLGDAESKRAQVMVKRHAHWTGIDFEISKDGHKAIVLDASNDFMRLMGVLIALEKYQSLKGNTTTLTTENFKVQTDYFSCSMFTYSQLKAVIDMPNIHSQFKADTVPIEQAPLILIQNAQRSETSLLAMQEELKKYHSEADIQASFANMHFDTRYDYQTYKQIRINTGIYHNVFKSVENLLAPLCENDAQLQLASQEVKIHLPSFVNTVRIDPIDSDDALNDSDQDDDYEPTYIDLVTVVNNEAAEEEDPYVNISALNDILAQDAASIPGVVESELPVPPENKQTAQTNNELRDQYQEKVSKIEKEHHSDEPEPESFKPGR